MKKWLIQIFIWVLLARVPLGDWEKLPSKADFLKKLGVAFCEKYVCNKSRVGVMVVGNEVLFFGDCLDNEPADA